MDPIVNTSPRQHKAKLSTSTVVKSSLIFGAALACFSTLYTIDEGNVGIVKRFGEATEQVNPGLHVKIPFADSVQELEICTRKNLERLRVSTNEQMPVDTEVSVNWTVVRSEAFELYKLYVGLNSLKTAFSIPVCDLPPRTRWPGSRLKRSFKIAER